MISAFWVPGMFLHNEKQGVDEKIMLDEFETTVDGSEIPRPTTWDV